MGARRGEVLMSSMLPVFRRSPETWVPFAKNGFGVDERKLARRFSSAGGSCGALLAVFRGMLQMVQRMGSRSKMQTLDKLLLPPDSDYLKKETQRMLAVKEKDLEKTEKSWRPALLEMCRRKGVDFETLALPKRLKNAVGLKVLCERQRFAACRESYTGARARCSLYWT